MSPIVLTYSSHPKKLVHQACFRSAHIAEDFADACRKEGYKAVTSSILKGMDTFDSVEGLGFRLAGYRVRWAPTWEHFTYE
jgi:hypothetical protein